MALIALDAMGGDLAPTETVLGAVDAAANGVDVVLVGDEGVVRSLLEDTGTDLSVVHAPEHVEMGENPAVAIRRKKGASVTVAARLVAHGEVAGMVSAGSTGAAIAAAAIVIGRLRGVRRPAIATIFPIGSGTVILDAGANIQASPKHLAQFGVMGSVLAQVYLGIEEPRVGLLNIGEEQGKGRELEKNAFRLLERMPIRFVGNVEGRDLGTDKADVFVTDGFTGNVMLKVAEGTARVIDRLVLGPVSEQEEAVEAAFLQQRLAALRQRLDPEAYGGAHVVGAKGVVVIAHGSSSRVAIANALQMAADGARSGLVRKIETALGG
ncbi:MAG: phosphate acyltransferase PlsX [Acidimicrobiia bacterium]